MNCIINTRMADGCTGTENKFNSSEGWGVSMWWSVCMSTTTNKETSIDIRTADKSF